jgi:hypothetical protein
MDLTGNKMTDFKIKPTKLHFEAVEDLSKVVRKVEYSIVATDGVNTAQSNHEAHLGLPDKSTFTAFDGLTEDAVVNWVKNGLGDYYQTLCDRLNAQLQGTATETNGSVAPPWQS